MPYFPEVTAPIAFEGKGSKNPLAFRFYDKDKKVGEKTMGEWLRFAVSYWHTLKPTGHRPLRARAPPNAALGRSRRSPVQQALDTLDAAFEFFTKLGVDYWCFHDRDLAPEGATLAESHKNLHHPRRCGEGQAGRRRA